MEINSIPKNRIYYSIEFYTILYYTFTERSTLIVKPIVLDN